MLTVVNFLFVYVKNIMYMRIAVRNINITGLSDNIIPLILSYIFHKL